MKYLLLGLLIVCSVAQALTFENYKKRPKLVVVLVIDQFRADYLTRYQSEFINPGAQGEVGGFNYLMKTGAYFPFAEYDVLQCVTCSGHAMISTGSHPVQNGISMNDWYDVSTKKKTYCVDDDEFGVSPRRLKTSTFGDELKTVSESSKVFAVALKDRSAVMLGGYRANLALWLSDNYDWETSGYYQKEVPPWVKDVNTKLSQSGVFKKDSNSENSKKIAAPYGNQMTREMAEAILKNEKLGLNGRTDVLAVSFSSHDMLGHQVGANAPEMKAMTLSEDKEISLLLTAIKKQLGSLNDVVIALTADHGVVHNIEVMQKAKMESARLDSLEMYKKINEHLNKKFGKSSKEWITTNMSFNLYLNPEALKERDVTSEQVQTALKEFIKTLPGIYDVATRSDIAKNILPVGEVGLQLTRQFIAANNGDVIVIPKPFHLPKEGPPVNHVTGYAYDRMVPLIISGLNVKAGVYSSKAKVIDLAPTLSFIMGTLPSATSQGRILNEIF